MTMLRPSPGQRLSARRRLGSIKPSNYKSAGGQMRYRKLTAAISLRPDYAEAHNLLAVCYDEKVQYHKAQEEYKRAIKLESSNARFLNNIGYSYYLSGEYKTRSSGIRRHSS